MVLTLVLISTLHAAPDVPLSSDWSAEPQLVKLTPRGKKKNQYEYYGLVPEGFHLVREVRKGLVIGGGVVFGIAWLGFAGLTAAIVPKNPPVYAIPLAGPFMLGTQIQGPVADLGILAVTAVGIAQFVGAIAMMFGVAFPGEYLEPDPAKPLAFRF
ncbi:MAG: hypothetical protein U0228_09155 [Myxococcaceae bacterium]